MEESQNSGILIAVRTPLWVRVYTLVYEIGSKSIYTS